MAGLGLVDSTTGLRFGTGLQFERPIGSGGLINPEEVPSEDSAEFSGVGSLRATATIAKRGQQSLSGSGGLSVSATVFLLGLTPQP